MKEERVWNLVARKLSAEATLEELRELEQILRDDPELAYQVDLYSSYFNASLQALQSPEEKQKNWEETKQKLSVEFAGFFGQTKPTKQRRTFGLLFSRPITSVALATCIILITIVSLLLFGDPASTAPSADNLLTVNELKTVPGTRTKMVLPDGTLVWLNSDSYLTYNNEFGKEKREITLTGEAYFDVFHNPDVPMVVHAGSVNIRVKGTAFNVRNYPETKSVETSLIRGSVELTTNDDPDRKILLKPNEKISIENNTKQISPAERKEVGTSSTPAYYHIGRLKESALSNTIPEISWIDNKLVFESERFSDVISKMEKWYNVQISLENKELALKNFSGVFEKETLFEALSALQMINHFDFAIEGNKVLIK